MLGTLVFVTMATVLVTAEQPADPVWPTKFTQDFTESFYYPILGTHTTTGTFYYDYANRRYRIDRENGRYDRYCGLNGAKFLHDTPCTQMVLDGVRYLVYPDVKECCRCCTAEHGCGILKPTWLSGAKYLGLKNYTDPTNQNIYTAHSWDQAGLQSNIYMETADADRKMLQIDQQPNDIQNYHPESLILDVTDPSVFELPEWCDPSTKCSVASTCRAVG